MCNTSNDSKELPGTPPSDVSRYSTEFVLGKYGHIVLFYMDPVNEMVSHFRVSIFAGPDRFSMYVFLESACYREHDI